MIENAQNASIGDRDFHKFLGLLGIVLLSPSITKHTLKKAPSARPKPRAAVAADP